MTSEEKEELDKLLEEAGSADRAPEPGQSLLAYQLQTARLALMEAKNQWYLYAGVAKSLSLQRRREKIKGACSP